MSDIETERLRKHNFKQALDIMTLGQENARLREALELYREAVRIDVKMEGPQFAGSNASALKRAWDHDRAILAEHGDK